MIQVLRGENVFAAFHHRHESYAKALLLVADSNEHIQSARMDKDSVIPGTSSLHKDLRGLSKARRTIDA